MKYFTIALGNMTSCVLLLGTPNASTSREHKIVSTRALLSASPQLNALDSYTDISVVFHNRCCSRQPNLVFRGRPLL